jgi:site-specific recombinase XerD
VSAPLSTEQLGAEWLLAMQGVLDPKTIAMYSLYVTTHLAPAFPSLLDVTTESVRAYQKRRLSKVQASSIRHELSCLRCLIRWAYESEKIADEIAVPGLPKRVRGTRYHKRRRAKPAELSPEEIEAFLRALPTKVKRTGYVRPRFVVAYEMGIRPATLDKLSVPEHWTPGSDWIVLSPETMKGREESRKRLTRRAKEALELAAPEDGGLVFGHHDYSWHVEKAAKVLAQEKAATFTGAHLRSAAITHFLEGGASLPAAQAFADHKRATTTDRYVRASERSLEAELARQGKL